MSYQQIAFNGVVSSNYIFCIDTQSTIPCDPGNTDYQEYLEWVAEGNTIAPAE